MASEMSKNSVLRWYSQLPRNERTSFLKELLQTLDLTDRLVVGMDKAPVYKDIIPALPIELLHEVLRHSTPSIDRFGIRFYRPKDEAQLVSRAWHAALQSHNPISFFLGAWYSPNHRETPLSCELSGHRQPDGEILRKKFEAMKRFQRGRPSSMTRIMFDSDECKSTDFNRNIPFRYYKGFVAICLGRSILIYDLRSSKVSKHHSPGREPIDTMSITGKYLFFRVHAVVHAIDLISRKMSHVRLPSCPPENYDLACDAGFAVIRMYSKYIQDNERCEGSVLLTRLLVWNAETNTSSQADYCFEMKCRTTRPDEPYGSHYECRNLDLSTRIPHIFIDVKTNSILFNVPAHNIRCEVARESMKLGHLDQPIQWVVERRELIPCQCHIPNAGDLGISRYNICPLHRKGSTHSAFNMDSTARNEAIDVLHHYGDDHSYSNLWDQRPSTYHTNDCRLACKGTRLFFNDDGQLWFWTQDSGSTLLTTNGSNCNACTSNFEKYQDYVEDVGYDFKVDCKGMIYRIDSHIEDDHPLTRWLHVKLRYSPWVAEYHVYGDVVEPIELETISEPAAESKYSTDIVGDSQFVVVFDWSSPAKMHVLSFDPDVHLDSEKFQLQ